jgi:serine/threonine-protein kinase HipA
MAQDYKDLLRLTRHLTRSETEVAAAYRNAVFNVLAHNRDDHLRQFAFMRRGGAWVRTPAYDLTFSNGPGGEHTLLVAGEGRSPQHAHLAELAKDAGIKPLVARAIVDQVRGALARWDDFASDAGVSTTSRKLVASKIKA